MSKRYDIVIIGAGGGGITAAFEAQRRGASVALLEKHKIGGECTHSGCVPSKALIDVAKHLHALQTVQKHGLAPLQQSGVFDFATAMQHVQRIVEGVYAHEQPQRFNDLGIDTYLDSSGGRFIDPHCVEIGGDRIHGDNIIIATGSGPRRLPATADQSITLLDNENFWALRELPQSIGFLGGGVISAELGQVMARFGARVTIIDRNDRLLSNVDPDVTAYLVQTFESMGIQMLTDADTQISAAPDGKICLDIQPRGDATGGESRHLVDQLFVAIGRVPNIDGLNLEAAGIDYTRRGITVNDSLQTSVPHVFAVGDVAARAKFSHVANYQAELVVRNLLNHEQRRNNLSVLPWAIFTDPEIGHVGMSEAEARQQLRGIQTFSVDAATDRFITDSKTGGFLKVVMDADNTIVGATGVGAHAGEWVQMFSLAIQQRLTAEDIANTIFTYPSYAEIVKKSCSRFLRTKL